jgi:asparagine synthetase B (glutamine-hydrolysing)
MSGFAGIGALRSRPQHLDGFLQSTDLAGTGHVAQVEVPGAECAVSAPSAYWLGRRVIRLEGASVALAGTPIVEQQIDWASLAARLRDGDPGCLAALSGRYALAVLDAVADAIYLATDRIGQHPLYVRAAGAGLAFSTSQASFCRWGDPIAVDERWVHESLLVNFSASHLSFLQGVRRLPAATLLRLDLRSGAVREHPYAGRFAANRVDAPHSSEVQRGAEVFARRMPLFLRSGERAFLGLSGGFDSRTLLAQFAGRAGLATYTYGIPGCMDLRESAAVARALQLDHREIPFVTEFTRNLADHAIDAVWLSSGLERAARATLPFVYRQLAVDAPGARTVLSGVSADQIFRGHGNVPSIVSDLMDSVFRTGSLGGREVSACRGMFVAAERAERSLAQLTEGLAARYGDLRRPESHLAYMTYEVPAEYFSGEASIADHFADFRSPFCDTEALSFAYSTALSTLGFSKFALGAPDVLGESRFPAALIAANPSLAALPIAGKPLWVYQRGSRAGFAFYRAKSAWLRRLPGRAPTAPLEDWKSWFGGPLRPFASGLLGPRARIEDYVRRDFIDACLNGARANWPHWLNKLVTMELVLRLAHQGWRRVAPEEVMSARAAAG